MNAVMDIPWMEPKDRMKGTVSQNEMNRYRMISFMCGTQKYTERL